MPPECVFCAIVAGDEPASTVYEDDDAICFMTLRPTRLGECVVIPKRHIDHYVDLPPELFAHLAEIVRRVGLAIRAEFEPVRVGLIVHGFGVPHMHFIVVPQHDPHDITSARFAEIQDGEIVFRHAQIPIRSRAELDADAGCLRRRLATEQMPY